MKKTYNAPLVKIVITENEQIIAASLVNGGSGGPGIGEVKAEGDWNIFDAEEDIDD